MTKYLEKDLEYWDKITRKNSKNLYAWEKKGWALGGLGRYEEALKCYDKALEINPKNANVLSAKNSVKRKIENRKREEM